MNLWTCMPNCNNKNRNFTGYRPFSLSIKEGIMNIKKERGRTSRKELAWRSSCLFRMQN